MVERRLHNATQRLQRKRGSGRLLLLLLLLTGGQRGGCGYYGGSLYNGRIFRCLFLCGFDFHVGE